LSDEVRKSSYNPSSYPPKLHEGIKAAGLKTALTDEGTS